MLDVFYLNTEYIYENMKNTSFLKAESCRNLCIVYNTPFLKVVSGSLVFVIDILGFGIDSCTRSYLLVPNIMLPCMSYHMHEEALVECNLTEKICLLILL